MPGWSGGQRVDAHIVRCDDGRDGHRGRYGRDGRRGRYGRGVERAVAVVPRVEEVAVVVSQRAVADDANVPSCSRPPPAL